MKKAGIQLLISVLIILGGWILLSQFDFLGDTTSESISRDTEERLGNLLIKQVELKYQKVSDEEVLEVINSIFDRLCEANEIDCSTINLYVYESDVINAFVLPGRQIVILTGLLGFSNSPEEFAGVLAHEIAHIEENHVMDRLVRELGTAIILTVTGMDAGAELLANILRILSSSAFSREQEREADAGAVQYMAKADIDPVHLANFLLNISTLETTAARPPEWMSSHPDSRRRAARIIEKRDEMEITPVPLTEKDWKELMGSYK